MRSRQLPSLTSATLLLLAPFAAAQMPDEPCGEGWGGFRRAGVWSGRVRALATWDPPGPESVGLYAAGEFTQSADGPVGRIVRWDGVRWSTLGAGLSATVTSLCPFDDGNGPRLFAGGTFLSAGGAPAFFVAAWDGTIWSPAGLGLSGNVHALCVHDDGTGPALYAAGDFSVPGDASGNRIARWNGSAWSAVGGGTDAIVWALAVHDDGGGAKLYAAGGFAQAGGAPAQKIACWNGTSWSPLGSGLNASAYALASHGGELWVGGDFGLANGVAVDLAARWNGTQFVHAGDFNLPVRRFFEVDLGAGERLFATGDFYQVSGVLASQIAEWNGSAWISPIPPTGTAYRYDAMCAYDPGGGPLLYAGRHHLSEVSPPIVELHGTAWTAVGPDRVWIRRLTAVAPWHAPDGRPALYVIGETGSSFGYWDGYSWTVLPPVQSFHTVHTMEVLDDGGGEALYIGGLFGDWHGLATRGVVRWDGAQFSALGPGLDDTVHALCRHDDGSGPAIYAGGAFTTSGGAPVPYVARWDGSAWLPLPPGPDGEVTALCVHDDGTGAKLYASGRFHTVGGVASPPVARWDGTQWEGVGDATFFGTYPDRRVGSLAVHDDGTGRRLYAAGYFPSSGSLGRVIRWDGTGWSQLGVVGIGNAGTNVLAMTSWDDGSGGGADLYIGGDFTNAGWRITRWDGAGFSDVVGGVGGVAVRDFAVLPREDGRSDLFFGGDFQTIGAGTIPSRNVARVVGCGPITSFCAGDGVDVHVTTDCPCANFGAPGRGCAWSNNLSGAVLASTGTRDPDTLVLHATGMPMVGTGTVFWKGDGLLSDAIPWGDGLRCVDGSLIRLGTKANAGGAAQYPEAGNAAISVRGQTPPGSGAVAYYQTSFRNAASFCTPFTFNATNGVRVVW